SGNTGRQDPRAASAAFRWSATTFAHGCTSLTSVFACACTARSRASEASLSALAAPRQFMAAAALRSGMIPLPCPWHGYPASILKFEPVSPTRQLIVCCRWSFEAATELPRCASSLAWKIAVCSSFLISPVIIAAPAHGTEYTSAHATTGAVAGPFGASPGQAEAADWQRYKGTTLFLLFYKHPWVDQIMKYFPEFESLTGMKLQFEVIPEVQGREKLVVEMTSGSGGIDAWHASMHVEKRRFWKSGWFQPLNAYLQDKTLTAEDYAWNDVTAGAKQAVTQPDQTISALPTFVDPFVFFYRKDLFDQKGWGPPRTMEELEDRAK